MHLDFETYSEEDITFGSEKYARHPSTRILICAVSTPHGIKAFQNPECEHADTRDNQLVVDALGAAIESGELLWAHNSTFEQAVATQRLLLDMKLTPPPIEQWRCTQAICRSAAILPSLEKAAKFLGVAEKDPLGKKLINIFSMPSKQQDAYTLVGQKYTRAEAWKLFVEYCKKDVEVEMQIHTKLKGYEVAGWQLEHFLFNARLNAKGAPINVSAAKRAVKFLEEANERLSEEFIGLTGLAPSQTKAFQVWLNENGYPHDNMQAQTVTNALEQEALPEVTRRALEIKSLVGYAAVKKLPTMVSCACEDGVARNNFKWWGAQRTGRDSGQGIQMQNMKRPEPELAPWTQEAYRSICNDVCYDDFTTLYGSVHAILASGIRHFIDPQTSYGFLDADFSNIEARCLVWLAGQDDVLQAYVDGVDMYCRMGELIYGFPVNKKTNPFERFVGKVAELACGYQGGGEAFAKMAKTMGVTVPPEIAKKAVKAYRGSRPKVVALWYATGEAAANAIKRPNKIYEVSKVKYVRTAKRGFDALHCILPSGRVLTYPLPKVKRVKKKFAATEYREASEFDADEITYYGAVSGKANWTRVETHGGKLVENFTQAIAGDFLAHGAIRAEKEGFDIRLVVHDQAVAMNGPNVSKEGFKECLCIKPEWALDFPLEASCDITPFYVKED